MQEAKIKIAFLDRDGVINKRPAEHEYVSKPEEFVFNNGIFNVLARLKAEGFGLIVVTNQRGIARGMLSLEDLSNIHTFMLKELASFGYKILDIFFCPHNLGECNCRKPYMGLVEQALAKYPIDLQQSIFIDDSAESVEAAKKIGIGKAVLVPKDKPEKFLEI